MATRQEGMKNDRRHDKNALEIDTKRKQAAQSPKGTIVCAKFAKIYRKFHAKIQIEYFD